MVDKLDGLTVFAVGQNYLYSLDQAKTLRNATSRRSAQAQAQREREHLFQLLHQVDQEIYTTLWALAQEVGEHGETERYHSLEAEANRVDGLEVDLHAYLDGRKPDATNVDPAEKANAEFVALATRARVAAASRRFVEAKARGSYDGDVIQELIKRKVAKDGRHATFTLNLSKGLAEGWSNEELLYWALCYRKARGNGEDKEVAVRVANKALTVGS